ncbi:hypothetical protein Aduo_011019 [Ancylostoma duodenale]
MTIATRTNMKKPVVDQAIAEQFLAADLDEVQKLQEDSKRYNYRTIVVYRNVALFAALHVGSLIGLYQVVFQAKWQTVAWMVFLHIFGGLGITAGAHRLWSHRSYKATLPVRILLMIMNSSALQNDIIEWARDHRCHHKWTDTHADPHNTTRGFFFAHMGWLLVRKHPQIKEQGTKLDLSDLFADPVCTFQRKFGFKPYDKAISPVESVWTTVSAIGEGGHNFHHTFPQDYRTSEYSLKLNWTRLFIDTCAALGLVYDRKSFSEEIIQRQCEKHGNPEHRGKAIL